MERVKHIMLSVIAIICIFALIGCAAQKDPQDKQNPEQSSGENIQPTDGNAQNPLLTWQTAVYAVPPFDAETSAELQLLTYESCQSYVAQQLQAHGTCDSEKCAFPDGQTADECDIAKGLKSISYPETFFNEKSLLLLQLPLGVDTPFEIKNVRYEGGVLTCTLKLFLSPEGTASLGATRYWSVFITVDQVLPQNTQIQLETEIGKAKT